MEHGIRWQLKMGQVIDSLTEAGVALKDAIGQPMQSPAVTERLATMLGWSDAQLALEETEDPESLEAKAAGIRVGSEDGLFHSIYFQIQPTDQLGAFEHLGKLFRGISEHPSRLSDREALGEPLISEYGNDRYAPAWSLRSAGSQRQLNARPGRGSLRSRSPLKTALSA